jgi:segregation and condensation protein B
LFATTRQFLDDLGLVSLDQLPLLESPVTDSGSFDALAQGVALMQVNHVEQRSGNSADVSPELNWSDEISVDIDNNQTSPPGAKT